VVKTNVGDTFVADEVIHEGSIGSDVELIALVVDSEGQPILAVRPESRYVYLLDSHGPDGEPQWINYGSFAELQETLAKF
jgi:hypothetical protein